jgi:putative selenium metabolism protein SsnA
MLIVNGTLVTWGDHSRIVENGALRIADGVIADVGSADELKARYPGEDAVDVNGQFVMPGNVCAHTHFYGAFARGLAIPGPAPKDFPEILECLWWPLDKALDAEAVRYSALVCLVDAVKHGTTTLFDHHASPNAIDGSLDIIADAVEEAGLRAVLCYEVTDRDGRAKAEAGIAENVRFLKAAQQCPLVAAMFGLHAGLTVGDETLRKCVRAVLGLDTGFHIHVAEHEVDEYHSVQQYGLRVVDRLQQAGILGPKTIVAHIVHTDTWEQALLRETGTWIAHQPRSNMNNGVGAAPLDAMTGSARTCGQNGRRLTCCTRWCTAIRAVRRVMALPVWRR